MGGTNRLRNRARAAGLALTAVAALSGCGQSGPTERAMAVSGPGVRATRPPQYVGLARRIKELGLPTGSSEKFHIHAQLSIYDHGLLVTVPANIGIDERHHIETTIHTHDATGIIHMEAPRPYRYTLGDRFDIWGARFGGGTLGALHDAGTNRVWVYVNGRRIGDPARYVLRNGDDVSIGYGTRASFPHRPSTYLLKQVMAGKSRLSCSAGSTKKQKSCTAPTPTKRN